VCDLNYLLSTRNFFTFQLENQTVSPLTAQNVSKHAPLPLQPRRRHLPPLLPHLRIPRAQPDGRFLFPRRNSDRSATAAQHGPAACEGIQCRECADKYAFKEGRAHEKPSGEEKPCADDGELAKRQDEGVLWELLATEGLPFVMSCCTRYLLLKKSWR